MYTWCNSAKCINTRSTVSHLISLFGKNRLEFKKNMTPMEKLPTFLLIGAARSGTTALYSYLRQHPEIFMSERKESNFFAFGDESLDCAGPGADYINNSIRTLSDYRRLFDNVGIEKAIGEACPLYLYSEMAPQRIRHHLPDVKLIAVLRNPIEQAFSHFLYARRQMLEPLDDFTSALESEVERKRKHWQPLFQYSQFPKYHQQLKRYYDVFPERQLRVYSYEEFVENPQAVLSDIYSFVGVDKAHVPDFSYRPNAGGVPKNRLLQGLVMKPHAATWLIGQLIPEHFKRRIRDAVSDYNLEKPLLPEDSKDYLVKELREDILKLQVLLKRDLSAWLQ